MKNTIDYNKLIYFNNKNPLFNPRSGEAPQLNNYNMFYMATNKNSSDSLNSLNKPNVFKSP